MAQTDFILTLEYYNILLRPIILHINKHYLVGVRGNTNTLQQEYGPDMN